MSFWSIVSRYGPIAVREVVKNIPGGGVAYDLIDAILKEAAKGRKVPEEPSGGLESDKRLRQVIALLERLSPVLELLAGTKDVPPKSDKWIKDAIETDGLIQTGQPVPAKRGMVVLANLGVLKKDMEIELVPKILPHEEPPKDPSSFRARIVNPYGGKDSIQWSVDGELYSPASLLDRLTESDYGASWVAGVCRNWRIVGHELSITDEAKSMISVVE